MDTSQSETINGINLKIAGIGKELDKLRRASELIPSLESDLKTLESAKSILIGKNGNMDNELKETIKAHPQRKREKDPNSIGVLAVQILKEIGTPLHVRDIAHRLNAKGKTATAISTTSACIRLKRDGILKRTYPNTFDLVNRN